MFNQRHNTVPQAVGLNLKAILTESRFDVSRSRFHDIVIERGAGRCSIDVSNWPRRATVSYLRCRRRGEESKQLQFDIFPGMRHARLLAFFVGLAYCPAIAVVAALDAIRGYDRFGSLLVLGAALAAFGWALFDALVV